MRELPDARGVVAYALMWGLAGGLVIGWVLCVLFRVRPILEGCR